jgi:hypothetical protein
LEGFQQKFQMMANFLPLQVDGCRMMVTGPQLMVVVC